MKHFLLAACITLGLAASAQAQTASSYQGKYYNVGATSPLQVTDTFQASAANCNQPPSPGRYEHGQSDDLYLGRSDQQHDTESEDVSLQSPNGWSAAVLAYARQLRGNTDGDQYRRERGERSNPFLQTRSSDCTDRSAGRPAVIWIGESITLSVRVCMKE